ncbi:MAG: hypothetical protein WDO15_22385 [Bacteroidota bacterium]
MDAWMVRPPNFDSSKKYPVLFYVYTEPWGATVTDTYGVAKNFLFDGDLSKEEYILISVDNRGTPSPKGRAWRKSISHKIGQLNIRDQAEAAKENHEVEVHRPGAYCCLGMERRRICHIESHVPVSKYL